MGSLDLMCKPVQKKGCEFFKKIWRGIGTVKRSCFSKPTTAMALVVYVTHDMAFYND